MFQYHNRVSCLASATVRLTYLLWEASTWKAKSRARSTLIVDPIFSFSKV